MTFRGPGGAVALVLVVACLALVGVGTPGARSAEPHCKVGAPPTLESAPELLEKPLSPELVVACGRSIVGPFEIVTYTGVRHSLCTFVLGTAFGGGQCGAAFHESRLAHLGFLVTTSNWAWGHGPGRAYTSINGWVRPDVARIEVRYHRNDQKPISRANATIGQVDGELLASLDQTEPFGRFAAVLPGCTPPQNLRIFAFDAKGRLIGSERGQKARFGSPCRPE